MEAGRGHSYARAGPPQLSSIGRAAPGRSAPRLDGFPTMMIMIMLPMVVGALAALVSSWTGFIEAAFMNMTLTLEGFDYAFGPAECGAWEECGNATFESYQRARDLSHVLFLMALIVVAAKDMLKGGLGDVSLGAVDTKTLPEMVKYSILVFALLYMFPPIWDAAAGTMNNVGLWILNPHYDIAGRGEYVHGAEGRAEGLPPMCVGDLTYDDLSELAPYVRDWDSWAIYRDGATGPTRGGAPSLYGQADNYIIGDGEVLTRECTHDKNSGTCPAGWNPGAAAVGYQIGDVLCNPDVRVKYVFRQALGVVETETVNPEQVLGAVTGTGGDDILVAILTQFLKSSVTLQVIMVVFMTGTMIDVVAAFALAILPIVPFYRFLPMSDKVRLGDYSGAAFALLAMPLIASLVLVAGSGAVANMAADADSRDFASFFVWLAAVSVILLVIAIPATMIPLIGFATQQATAAIQTGVMTAQFAATSVAAGAGGAVRGRRESLEFRRLHGMRPSAMSPAQRTRLNELQTQGYDKMSTARAALQGGASGLRGQIYGQDGKPTDAFRNVVMPGTGELTDKSVRGLSGFDGGDATRGMPDLPGIVSTTTADATKAAKREMGQEPTKRELLETAEKQATKAVKDLKDADARVADAREDAEKTDGYGEVAGKLAKEENLADGERTNRVKAENGLKKMRASLTAAEAKGDDLVAKWYGLENEMAKAGAERRAEIEREIADTRKKIVDTSNSMGKMRESATGFEVEMERSTKALNRHTRAADDELARLARLAASGAIGGPVGRAILEEQAAYAAQKEAVARHEEVVANHEGLQKEIRQQHREQHTDAVRQRGWREAEPKISGRSGSRHPLVGGGSSTDNPPQPPTKPSKPPVGSATATPPAESTVPDNDGKSSGDDAGTVVSAPDGMVGSDGGQDGVGADGFSPDDVTGRVRRGRGDGGGDAQQDGGDDDKSAGDGAEGGDGDPDDDAPAHKPSAKKPPGPGAVSGVVLNKI